MGQAEWAEGSRYRLLVDAITDYAIFMLDSDGRVTSWSSGAERLNGYRPDEIYGAPFSCLFTEGDRREGAPERALHAAATDGAFDTRGSCVRKDGSTFRAHMALHRVRDPNGELVGYAGITRVLKSRLETEGVPDRNEEQFRLLVQSVTDYAIFMLDPKGHVSSWNPGAERIKGYRPAEIIGRHFSCFYTDEDRALDEPAHTLAAARSDGRCVREGWRVRKDGSRFWARVVVDPIWAEGGGLVGYAKVTRDLTEREQSQRDLGLAREALFQSRKMDAIGQLTGGVAHDFNNLLMATLGSLELLRKRVADDPQALRLLDTAVEGARRGATLTQRMLAFARRQDLRPVHVEIPNLVRGMADLIKRALGPAISIDIRFPLTLSAVIADFNQLEMALLNLVVNARDAMPNGGPITIAAAEHLVGAREQDGLMPGRYVSLSVIDQGDGMDVDTLAHAAEPFFTTKGVGKGTGLGLSMVHGLAEQSGGRFFLKSMPGKGTTASLWLPAAEEEATREEAEPHADPAPKTVAQSLRILVVDDDSLVLMNTVALLEDLGHAVFEANSGREALTVLQREPQIDLVITDQAMPNMTGLELADQVMAERPGVPFIIATGYGEIPLHGNPALRKLGKPFSQGDLAQAVADAVLTA